VDDGDYVIVVTEPATYGVQAYENGTHVITVRGRLSSFRPAAPESIEVSPATKQRIQDAARRCFP
jgi:hypothetical protein